MILALARFAATPTSNAIVAGQESDDPFIRRMAAAAKELTSMYEIMRAERLMEYESEDDGEK